MLTKNAISNLKNRYKAVLKKCTLMNVFGSLAIASLAVASLSFGGATLLPKSAHALEYTANDYSIEKVDPATTYFKSFEVDGEKYGLLFRNVYDNNSSTGSINTLLSSYEAYSDDNGTGLPTRLSNPTGDITDSFVGLSSTDAGGAISISPNNSLNSLKASFIGNTSLQDGGAIYTAGTINEVNASFIANAAKNGGALYNAGTSYNNDTIRTLSASFIGNMAAVSGGAIYNKGTINFFTSNGLSLFAGNTANDVSNALHNEGIFNINTGFDSSNPQNGMGYVHIKDNISGAANAITNRPNGTISINSDLAGRTDDLQNGFVMMDGIITDNTLNLSGGSLFFTDGKAQEHFAGGTGSDFVTASGSVLYLDVDDEISADNKEIKGTVAYNVLDSNRTHFSPTIPSAAIFARAYTYKTNYEYIGDRYAIAGASDGLSAAITHPSNLGTLRTYSVTGVNETLTASHNPNLTQGTLTLFGNRSVNDQYQINADGNQLVNVSSAGTLNILDAWIHSADGSAIETSGTVNIFNSFFEQNTGNAGGVINAVSGSVTNIYNTQFSNNATTGQGGAINIENNAVVNLYAAYDDTLFSDNTANSQSSAIHNEGTLNLRAQGGTIIFNDSISGDGPVTINDAYHSGTIAINADMSGYAGDVTFNNGMISVDGALSPTSATAYTPFFNKFTVNGGTLNAINEKMDRFNMTNWKTSAPLNARIDLDLSTKKADYFANSTGQKINITAIDLIENSSATSTDSQQIASSEIEITNNGTNFTLGTKKAYSPTQMYTVSDAKLQSDGLIAFSDRQANPMISGPDINSNITTNLNLDLTGNVLDNMMSNNPSPLETLYTNILNGSVDFADLSSETIEALANYMAQNGIASLLIDEETSANGTTISTLLNSDGSINVSVDFDAKSLYTVVLNGTTDFNTLTDVEQKIILDYMDTEGIFSLDLGLSPEGNGITLTLLADGTVHENRFANSVIADPAGIAAFNEALAGLKAAADIEKITSETGMKTPRVALVTSISISRALNEALAANPTAKMSITLNAGLEKGVQIKSYAFMNGQWVLVGEREEVSNLGKNSGSVPAILEQALYANSIQNNWTSWAESYVNFESTDTGANSIDTESYGVLAGINSRRFDVGAFDLAYSAYIGYNGAQSDYSTVDTEQNGGTIGLGATLFYDAFTLGATINATLSNNSIENQDSANAFYTKDSYNSTTLGFGINGAYTFSFQEGKYNLRPSLGLSYSHVNTEDYTNSAGLHTKPDASRTWQVSPALTFVANFENNWSLNATAKYNFLIKESSVTYVDGLPFASEDVDDYATLSLGARKAWDNFSLYGELTSNVGGRESIGANVGFEVKF